MRFEDYIMVCRSSLNLTPKRSYRWYMSIVSRTRKQYLRHSHKRYGSRWDMRYLRINWQFMMSGTWHRARKCTAAHSDFQRKSRLLVHEWITRQIYLNQSSQVKLGHLPPRFPPREIYGQGSLFKVHYSYAIINYMKFAILARLRCTTLWY